MLKFLQAVEKIEISNFFNWFWLKDESLDQKLDTFVFSHDSEELWKDSAKSESWFPIQPTKKLLKFLGAGEKVKISNFFSWFWLKDKLLIKKVDLSVSCHDSEELWKVSAKSDSLFPIQPLKKC